MHGASLSEHRDVLKCLQTVCATSPVTRPRYRRTELPAVRHIVQVVPVSGPGSPRRSCSGILAAKVGVQPEVGRTAGSFNCDYGAQRPDHFAQYICSKCVVSVVYCFPVPCCVVTLLTFCLLRGSLCYCDAVCRYWRRSVSRSCESVKSDPRFYWKVLN